MRAKVPADRLEFDWYERDQDPTGNYPVDARINHMRRPLFVYALPNDDKVNVATISLLTFEKWRIPFQSLGIFEDQASTARRVVARFTDVCERMYSSLEGNKERIAAYLERTLAE